MKPPNVLFVFGDQWRAQATGYAGNQTVQTPNLDRLVAEGVRFDAAYSNCPVCAPARGAVLSGRYVSNCKTYDNASPWPQDMVTIPHYLTLAGYDTVASGKMHYAGPDQLHGLRRRLTTDIYPSSFSWVPTAQRARENRFIDRRQHANGYRLPREIGAQYEYSNYGAGLLGHILAMRAGVSYEELVIRRIADPLAMPATRIRKCLPGLRTRKSRTRRGARAAL